MNEPLFKSEWIKLSEGPSNYIPKDAEIVIGVDYSTGVDCTVKGFIDEDGSIYIQESVYNAGC